MAVTFYDLGSDAGLKKLDEYLLTRSLYFWYVNVSHWYNHINALLRISEVSAEGCGVIVEGSAPVTDTVATPPVEDSKAAAAEDDDDDDDLFGEETEEEKKAAEERAAAMKANARRKNLASHQFCWISSHGMMRPT
ncbi:hypothetical protein SLA2020_487400 [Shorea laevis]